MAGKKPSRRKSSTPKKSARTPIPLQDGVAPSQPGGRVETPPAGEAYPAIQEEIRLRAYELYEARGRHDGFEQEDWMRAETEILAKYRSKSA